MPGYRDSGRWRTLLHLAVWVACGVALSIWVAQIVWLAASESRVDAYARAILLQADSVADNIVTALEAINRDSNPICREDDQASLKQIAFHYRFVRDAGRMIDRDVQCSALWGASAKYRIEGDGKLGKTGSMLWRAVFDDDGRHINVDITSRGSAFVVTSPVAFSSFESPPEELSARVTSADGQLIMRSFGQLKRLGYLEGKNVRVCSDRFSICVEAQVQSHVLSCKHAGLLGLVILLGAVFGGLAWYALNHRITQSRSLPVRLKKAIRHSRIDLVYQPIVQAGSGRICGMEVLSRWHDPEFGWVAPDSFFSVAAELGLAFDLNKIVLRKCLAELSSVLQANPPLYASINLAARDLLDPRTLVFLKAEAARANVRLAQLAIEVLESSTANMAMVAQKIDEFRALGGQVFVDDFGAGYSSLSYLANLRVDKIKIDRSFTSAVGDCSPAAFALLKVNEIAEAMDAQVIFEGVETEQQRQAVLNFCPQAFAQGWLFSKALPIDELLSRIDLASLTLKP
ncbi:putative signal transduction protein [Pseudomonas asplenii]|nr:putative signal transduction protein [Pseudomonas fuscovaginae]